MNQEIENMRIFLNHSIDYWEKELAKAKSEIEQLKYEVVINTLNFVLREVNVQTKDRIDE